MQTVKLWNFRKKEDESGWPESIDQVIICQRLNLQKRIQHFEFVASILLMVGAAMSISNFYSIKLTVLLFSDQIIVSHSNTVSLLAGVTANQSSEKC